MKNGFTMKTQKGRNHGDHLAMLQHLQLSQIFMDKNSSCAVGGISLVSCIMSCSNRTKQLLGLSTEHNWWELVEHSRKSAPTATSDTTKVILLHDNARPHVAAPVKTYLETLKWGVLPHPSYLPDIAPSDFHLFLSMTPVWAALHIIWKYQILCRFVDSLKRFILPTWCPYVARKMGKSSGKRWTILRIKRKLPFFLQEMPNFW